MDYRYISNDHFMTPERFELFFQQIQTSHDKILLGQQANEYAILEVFSK